MDVREPSAPEERAISERAGHLKALLDAARESGLCGHPEYGWNTARPAEPRVIVADVPVHAEGTDDAEYVINGGRRISVTRVDLALRAVRAIGAATGRTP